MRSLIRLKREEPVRQSYAEAPTQRAGERPVLTRLLLAGGAIGSLLNVVVVLVLGATRSDYNAWQLPDSSLELGDGGWIQIANYVVTGALLIGFAIGLRRCLRVGRGATWGPVLIGLYGVTFIAAGIFVTDPELGYPAGASSTATVHGILHIISGQLQFLSVIAACFVLARRDAADAAERGWARYSAATGLLVAISYVGFILIGTTWDGGPLGLIERIGIFAGGSWVTLLVIRFMSNRSRRMTRLLPTQ